MGIHSRGRQRPVGYFLLRPFGPLMIVVNANVSERP